MQCKECGEEFATRKSLHGHVKVHGLLMGEYYIKFYGRKNLLTGDLLPFKKYETYFERDFRDCSEMEEYLLKKDKKTSKNYIKEQYIKWGKRYGSVDAPTYNEAATNGWLPSVEACIHAYGSYGAAMKDCGFELTLPKPLPKNFWDLDVHAPTYMVDTREQYPFKFKNQYVSKIDVGDYTLTGEDYNYTFVDRKALGDFISTVSSGNYDRFCKEMDRARALGVKLFVVVEASTDDIKAHGMKFAKRANSEYIFGRMRKIQRDYADTCRFVFAGSREKAHELTARILTAGKSVWDCDIQYFIK